MRKITYYRIAAVFPIVLPLTAKLIDVAWGDPLASFPAVWIVVDSLAGAAIVFGPLYAALSALALFWLRNRPSGSYEKLAFAAPLLMGGAVSMWALLQEGFYGSPAGTTTIGPLFLMTVCVGYLYVFVAFGVLLVLQQLRLVDGAVSS